MSRTQRLAMLGVAALIAVVALIAIPRGDDNDTPQPAAQTVEQAPAETPVDDAATTETAPAAKPKPKPPLLRAGSERELEYTKGETVRFRVRRSAPEEVHVHGYDISRDLEAGKTRTVSFKANIEGIFEIELEHSGTPIASLKVEPR